MADFSWPFPSGNFTMPINGSPIVVQTSAALSASIPLKQGTYAVTTSYSDPARPTPTSVIVIGADGKEQDMLDLNQLGTATDQQAWAMAMASAFAAGATVTIQKLGKDEPSASSAISIGLLAVAGLALVWLLTRKD